MLPKTSFIIFFALLLQSCTNTFSDVEIDSFVQGDEQTQSLMEKARNNRVVNPYFWKVTSKEGKVSHLFGTIHVGVPIGKIPYRIITQFRNSQILITETDPAYFSGEAPEGESPIQKILKEHSDTLLLPDGQKLQSLVSEEAFNVLTTGTKLPPDFLNSLTPYGAKFFYDFMSLAIGISTVPEGKLDEEIILRAKGTGTKTAFLETAADAENYIELALGYNQKEADEYNAENANIYLLNDAIESRAAVLKDLLSLIVVYKSGDLNSLTTYAKKQFEESPNLKAELVDKRNEKWMTTLSDTFKKGSAFVAVGVLHIPGDTGLISMLEKSGYTVQRL